jgi:hypothetical protein
MRRLLSVPKTLERLFLVGIAAVPAVVSYACTEGFGPEETTPPVLPPASLEDLPVADGQPRSSGFSYGRNLRAGESYSDPTTGVSVYKVTDANTPPGNSRAYHSYAAGGPFISLPWGANNAWYTLYFHPRFVSNDAWFVDFNIETGQFANYRQGPSDLQGADGENAFAFSFNPATPRIGYKNPGSYIERFDTETMADANTGFFPKNLSPWGIDRGHQFKVDVNDGWFATEQYPKRQVVLWNSQTNEVRFHDESDITGIHLDLSGVYGFVEVDHSSGNVQFRRWDLAGNQLYGRSSVFQSHSATLRGYLVSVDPSTSGGPQLYQYEATADRVTNLGAPGEVINSSGHFAGQWVHGNGSGTGQWALFSGWGSPNGSKVNNAIVFIPLDYPAREVRLLAHHDSSPGNDYYAQPHATLSPDGQLVMWTSNMNGSGRLDVFVAVVPAR